MEKDVVLLRAIESLKESVDSLRLISQQSLNQSKGWSLDERFTGKNSNVGVWNWDEIVNTGAGKNQGATVISYWPQKVMIKSIIVGMFVNDTSALGLFRQLAWSEFFMYSPANDSPLSGSVIRGDNSPTAVKYPLFNIPVNGVGSYAQIDFNNVLTVSEEIRFTFQCSTVVDCVVTDTFKARIQVVYEV